MSSSPGASHYAKGSALNMLRSMAVIAALMAAIFFLVPGTNSVTPQQRDLDVPGTAQHYAVQAQQPFAYPEGLPEGWTATSVRYVRSKGDVMMWSATWTTPDGQYASIQQVADATEDWVNTQTNNGTRLGTVTTEDGRTWIKRDREAKVQRSLVHRPVGAKGLTTLLTGTASFDQLVTLADHLTAADPTAS